MSPVFIAELFAEPIDVGGHHFDTLLPKFAQKSSAAGRSLDVAEGMWVALPDGRVGRVDHVMTEGTLNLGDVEMPATPDDPAALVSVWDEDEFDEPVAVKVADLQVAEQPEAARAYQDKPKRKPRKGKRGS
jgi:hypothetical protein